MPKTPEELEKLLEEQSKKIDAADARSKSAEAAAVDSKSNVEAILKKIGGANAGTPAGDASAGNSAGAGSSAEKCGCGCGGKLGAHVYHIFPFPGWSAGA